MSTLRQLVSATTVIPDELPLIHTSLSKNLPSFTSVGRIEPQPCRVFGSNLVYLFYGRPAYRPKKPTRFGDPIALCPVCFVFKPRSVSKSIHAVYPCDTGATHDNRFSPEIGRDDLPDLALDPRIESARQLVGLLFETNFKYFGGTVAVGKSFASDSLEDRFYRLLQKKGPVDYDDRKSAVEIGIDRAITLADQLLLVVLPYEFLDDPAVLDVIHNQWNCEAEGYDTCDGDKPEVYYSVVRQKVADALRAQGVFR